MKKNQFAMISVTFILGAVFGISLFSVLSFVNPGDPPSPNQDLSVVTIPDANKLFKNYYFRADSVNDKFKGFLVDRLQLEAMNNLLSNDRNLTGFRLYMGKSETYESIGIVVGVTAGASDAALGRIYKTASKQSGPCPYICDENSPITNLKN